ncbi:MAG: hypothetical protein FJ037_09925 [Chloroflexi bacterium]|nr:hypothetical protein [Chloroflexota bacterium]
MRYRRLGRTEWMVSEVGINLRALEGLDEAAAGATFGAAIASGVTLVLVDVREHEGSLEPLVGRVMASERPRLAVLSRFERIAEAPAFAAQLLAAGARLGKEGFLDIALLTQIPDPAQRAVLDELAATRMVRAWGIETADAALATRAFEAGARTLVAPADAGEPLLVAAQAGDAGVIVKGDVATVAGTLADARVASVAGEVTTAGEVDLLTRAALRG